jgi:hypothetical protein
MSAIPAELRELPQWVIWRYKKRRGKLTKVPYQSAQPERTASTADPATWATFELAKAVMDADGVGFVFTEHDPYLGVDFDGCVDGEAVHPFVLALVRALDSYTEVSVSGTGLHSILEAKLTGRHRCTRKTPWRGAFENYDRRRFFCVTGRHLRETPTTINERQAELDSVRAKLFPGREKCQKARPDAFGADERELLKLARNARNSAAFDALYSGQHSYGSASQADMALCNKLAFWTGRNAALIDSLFRASGLMRAKWDERRGDSTYGALTVEKAVAECHQVYEPWHGSNRPSRTDSTSRPSARTYEVNSDGRGRLVLPETPDVDDLTGHCAWLTEVFALDRNHPITGGRREGIFGLESHVALYRADAPPIRFEPMARVNTPMKLIETLSSRMICTDGKVPPFKGDHCRAIAYVVRMLCGTTDALTDEQEAAGIVGTFMQMAVPVEGCTTYGTTGQRYEAALALRRPLDENSGRPIEQPRYLIDANTGEMVIPVGELAEAGRRHVGSSLPRGWLDGRIEALGWRRVTLDGHALPGRGGRQGPHARINVYRGLLTSDDRRASQLGDSDNTVTT